MKRRGENGEAAAKRVVAGCLAAEQERYGVHPQDAPTPKKQK